MTRLNIRKYINQNKKNAGYQKTYARLVSVDTLDTNDLCRHIQKHGSIFTSDVVKGVIEKFVNCFNELLLEGHKIKLNGLGTFYLSIATKGEADPKEFTASNIKAVRLKFLGDKSKESEYATQILTSQAQFRDINTLVGGEVEDPDNGGGENPENGGGSSSSGSNEGPVNP
ncbi:DNA-binding protein, histone-like, putative [Prevotella communis]|uniref:DNA-binding protein, histone-like, putative n=2 Tax=Prevotella communis TaxID=2913614 RepID=A0A1G8CFQ4_9BACT|nr:HU family DNA-binding protein [Prevotella communis]SDH44316.1 DNA-binding protein, histone-like, putative [Prevotella communis]